MTHKTVRKNANVERILSQPQNVVDFSYVKGRHKSGGSKAQQTCGHICCENIGERRSK